HHCASPRMLSSPARIIWFTRASFGFCAHLCMLPRMLELTRACSRFSAHVELSRAHHYVSARMLSSPARILTLYKQKNSSQICRSLACEEDASFLYLVCNELFHGAFFLKLGVPR